VDEDLSTQQTQQIGELKQAFGTRLDSIETFLVAIGNAINAMSGNVDTLTGQVRAFIYDDRIGRTLMAMGQIRAAQLASHTTIPDLAAVEFKVFSQWGEDGIIEWLVSKLPGIPPTFVEFGVENFGEANCHFLMENRNWKGLVIDGSEAHMDQLRHTVLHWQHDLTAVTGFVTAENIDQLITRNGFAGDLGILSIDIDGNDYWVWDAIKSVNPAIVSCEMNGVLGDLHPISIPYDPAFERLKAHYSGQYFGTSVAALKHLGAQKGYTFVGTNSRGVNAFFVRNDLAGNILPLIDRITTYPSVHRDSRGPGGDLTFLAGAKRLELISHLPVIDVTTGNDICLRDLGQLYSEEWRRRMNYDAGSADRAK
jgi:hypothetical protein